MRYYFTIFTIIVIIVVSVLNIVVFYDVLFKNIVRINISFPVFDDDVL